MSNFFPVLLTNFGFYSIMMLRSKVQKPFKLYIRILGMNGHYYFETCLVSSAKYMLKRGSLDPNLICKLSWSQIQQLHQFF